MKINNKGYAITLIVFGILIVFIVVLSTLLITMNNSVKLNKTVKESVVESIQLGEDTSGTSFIDRIEAIESKLSDINGNIIDTIYPIGSVYITATDATVGAVEDRFPGTYWQKYAQGRTLIGEGTGTDKNGNAQIFTNNSEGGEYIHTLSASEMPSHSHSYTPSGSVSSSFNNGVAGSAGSHTHGIGLNPSNGWLGVDIPNSITTVDDAGIVRGKGTISDRPATSYYTGTFIQSAGLHIHTVTGIVSSQFSGTTTNTESTGSGTSFNMQNPYITVYMYKRIN